MTKEKLDEKYFSQYTIQTKCSPDGIKLWVNRPFWVETYDELFALIKNLDIIDRHPDAEIIVGGKQ